MQQKTARLTILIDPKNKTEFEAICASHDLTASHVVRQLILEYLQAHGIPVGEKGGETDLPAGD